MTSGSTSDPSSCGLYEKASELCLLSGRGVMGDVPWGVECAVVHVFVCTQWLEVLPVERIQPAGGHSSAGERPCRRSVLASSAVKNID